MSKHSFGGYRVRPNHALAGWDFPSFSLLLPVLCFRLSLKPLKEHRSWNGLLLSTKRST